MQKLDPKSTDSLQGTGTQSCYHKALKFANLLEPGDSLLARDIKENNNFGPVCGPKQQAQLSHPVTGFKLTQIRCESKGLLSEAAKFVLNS